MSEQNVKQGQRDLTTTCIFRMNTCRIGCRDSHFLKAPVNMAVQAITVHWHHSTAAEWELFGDFNQIFGKMIYVKV